MDCSLLWSAGCWVNHYTFDFLEKDKRVNQTDSKQVPPGFQATNEIIVDPVDQKKRQIYFNPTTGERFYKIIE